MLFLDRVKRSQRYPATQSARSWILCETPAKQKQHEEHLRATALENQSGQWGHLSDNFHCALQALKKAISVAPRGRRSTDLLNITATCRIKRSLNGSTCSGGLIGHVYTFLLYRLTVWTFLPPGFDDDLMSCDVCLEQRRSLRSLYISHYFWMLFLSRHCYVCLAFL